MENRDVAYLLDVICNSMDRTSSMVPIPDSFWDGIFKFYRTNSFPDSDNDFESTVVHLAVRTLNNKHMNEGNYRYYMEMLYAMAYYKGRAAVVEKFDFPLKKEIISETNNKIQMLVGKIAALRKQRVDLEHAFFAENDELFIDALNRKDVDAARAFSTNFNVFAKKREKAMNDECEAGDSLFAMMMGLSEECVSPQLRKDEQFNFGGFVGGEIEKFSGAGKSADGRGKNSTDTDGGKGGANPDGEGK